MTNLFLACNHICRSKLVNDIQISIFILSILDNLLRAPVECNEITQGIYH